MQQSGSGAAEVPLWELWVREDGAHIWYDPQNPWRTRPRGGFALQGQYRIDRERGLVDGAEGLPAGAILARPDKQHLYGMGGPHYLYLDLHRTCRSCHQPFVFEAGEQQFWYEEARIWNVITARRCQRCRASEKHRKQVQRDLMAAHEAVDAAPDDPEANLGLARAILASAGAVGRHTYQKALGAAHRAARRSDLEDEALALEAELRALLDPET